MPWNRIEPMTYNQHKDLSSRTNVQGQKAVPSPAVLGSGPMHMLVVQPLQKLRIAVW